MRALGALVALAALPMVASPIVAAVAAQGPAGTRLLTPADDAALRAFVAAFQTAWNARDAKALASMFRPDADQAAAWLPGVRGRSEIERQWSGLFPQVPRGVSIRIDVESIRPLTNGIVVLDVTGNFSGRADDGSPIRRMSDRATYLLTRDGAGWAIASFRVFEAAVTPEVMNGIGAARERFINAWRRNDAAGAAAVFSADAINMIPGAPDNRGRREIERAFADFLGSVTIEHVEFTPQELDGRAYVAYERGSFVQRHKPRDGARSVTMNARYMAVWRREPGGDWQFHRFLFNEVPAKP
jgi:uncharacterized protein (TIGR02246 family)